MKPATSVKWSHKSPGVDTTRNVGKFFHDRAAEGVKIGFGCIKQRDDHYRLATNREGDLGGGQGRIGGNNGESRDGDHDHCRHRRRRSETGQEWRCCARACVHYAPASS